MTVKENAAESQLQAALCWFNSTRLIFHLSDESLVSTFPHVDLREKFQFYITLKRLPTMHPS